MLKDWADKICYQEPILYTIDDIMQAIAFTQPLDISTSIAFCNCIQLLDCGDGRDGIITAAGVVPVLLRLLHHWSGVLEVLQDVCWALLALVRSGAESLKLEMYAAPDCFALLRAAASLPGWEDENAAAELLLELGLLALA